MLHHPLRIAVVSPDLPDPTAGARVRAALEVSAPGAAIAEVGPGRPLPVGTEAVLLLPVAAGGASEAHDRAIAAALLAGLPVLGTLGGSPAPGGGVHGGRRAGDLLGAPGTRWRAGAGLVWAPGHPFAVLADDPLAPGAHRPGHRILDDLVHAAHARRAAPAGGPPDMAGPATTGRPVAAGAGAAAPATLLGLLPDDGVPRSYVHQARGAGAAWWRPLLALLAGVATFGVLALVITVVTLLTTPSPPSGGDPADLDLASPGAMLSGNLLLAALIPASLVAMRAGHGRPAGRVLAVGGRVRWGWLLRASAVTLLVWSSYLTLAWVLSGEQPGPRPDHAGWLLVITLLTTPLQAAGEEVAFRGGLLQGVGAWIRDERVALAVGTVLSAGLFALAHGSLDPWVLLELGVFAACACYLTWRTGGLEAAIALHVVNNLLILLGLTLLGGLEDAYITTGTTSDPLSTLVGSVATIAMTALLLWQARRAGVAPPRRGAPAVG